MVCLEPSHCHDQARVNLLGNVIINIWHSLPLQWPVGSLCKFIARERNAHNEGCLLVLHWIELAGYGTASLKCHGRLIRQLTYCVRITAWHIPDIHHSLHFKSVMEVRDRPVSHGSISIRAAITSFWMDQDDASLAKLSSTTWRITFWTSVSQQSREAHTAQPYEGDVWILMRLTTGKGCETVSWATANNEIRLKAGSDGVGVPEIDSSSCRAWGRTGRHSAMWLDQVIKCNFPAEEREMVQTRGSCATPQPRRGHSGLYRQAGSGGISPDESHMAGCSRGRYEIFQVRAMLMGWCMHSICLALLRI